MFRRGPTCGEELTARTAFPFHALDGHGKGFGLGTCAEPDVD